MLYPCNIGSILQNILVATCQCISRHADGNGRCVVEMIYKSMKFVILRTILLMDFFINVSVRSIDD